MEDPAPADPPRIFWKSRRSGACCPELPIPTYKILLISIFFYPKHRLLVTHPSLSVFSLLEVESWLISFQFDFPANFSNSVQKKIIEQLDSHLNTSNLGLLRFPLRSLLFGDQNIFPFYS